MREDRALSTRRPRVMPGPLGRPERQPRRMPSGSRSRASRPPLSKRGLAEQPARGGPGDGRDYQEQPDLRQRLAGDENRRAEAAGRVDRQPRHVDEREMQREQGEPDDQAAHFEIRGRVGGAENDRGEDEGGEKLGQDRGAEPILAEIALAPAVLAEPRGGARGADPYWPSRPFPRPVRAEPQGDKIVAPDLPLPHQHQQPGAGDAAD